MTRHLLAPALLVLSIVPPARDQTPAKGVVAKDGQAQKALFVPGVTVGKTLYISGKGDYRPKEPFPKKVENCLNEIRNTLRMAGLDMQHVVKSFVYLEDHDQFAEFNRQYAKFFPNNPPARTTLGVALVPGDSRVEITCIAYSDLSERKSIGTAPAGLPFSPGVLAGDTLYVSGKGDHLSDGSHPATFEEQTRQAMRNVQTTLKEADLDFGHVVMSHVFLDDPANLAIVKRVYRESFSEGDEPACATIMVDWIPGGSHVEVTCIATADLSRRKVVRPAGVSLGDGVAASPAVWAGDTLYISGLGGPGASGLADQFHAMARAHTKVLEAAGLKLDDLVSGCVYLRDMEDYQPMNAIYREYFSRGPGVRTCLMPSAVEKTAPLVQASFIAARAR